MLDLFLFLMLTMLLSKQYLERIYGRNCCFLLLHMTVGVQRQDVFTVSDTFFY